MVSGLVMFGVFARTWTHPGVILHHSFHFSLHLLVHGRHVVVPFFSQLDELGYDLPISS